MKEVQDVLLKLKQINQERKKNSSWCHGELVVVEELKFNYDVGIRLF